MAEPQRTDLVYREVVISGDMANYVTYAEDDLWALTFQQTVAAVKFSFDSLSRDIEKVVALCWQVGRYARIWSFKPSWRGNTSSLNVTYKIDGEAMFIKIDGFPKDERLEIDVMVHGPFGYPKLENQSIFVNLKKDRGNLYG